MEFRAFVAKAPHLTKPRQRTLVYKGKLLFSNAAAKLPKAISQKRQAGFSFLNDGNLDKCLSKKKVRLATPALWLSSPHWAKCMTKSKFLETACKNYCTHTSAPVTCVYLDLGISQTVEAFSQTDVKTNVYKGCWARGCHGNSISFPVWEIPRSRFTHVTGRQPMSAVVFACYFECLLNG